MTDCAKRVRVRCLVAAAEVDQAPSDRRRLADAEAQLNMMVHSRQHGLDWVPARNAGGAVLRGDRVPSNKCVGLAPEPGRRDF